ncbi:MAG: hypothetical protein BWY76_03487 [bacterium ADurb.Bin429]|nr:MAG: hypothetical protein BWY76_03487 [bacterium ADurb.Bin429]
MRTDSPTWSTRAPNSRINWHILSISLICGTLWSTTSPSTSKAAARMGSAPFFVPFSRTSPRSGVPPITFKQFGIAIRVLSSVGNPGSLLVSHYTGNPGISVTQLRLAQWGEQRISC